MSDGLHIGIWGRSQSGKTTRAKRILRDRARVVVFDPLGEYDGARVASLTALRDALKRRWRGRCSIAYVPPEGSDPIAELDGVAWFLRRAQQPYLDGTDRRLMTLCVDELAMSFPNHRMPRSEFAGLCSRGRHFGIQIIGTSQRMAEVGTAFRGNTCEDYFFPLRAAVDYDAAGQLIGREHVAALKALEPHHYLRYAGGRIEAGKN